MSLTFRCETFKHHRIGTGTFSPPRLLLARAKKIFLIQITVFFFQQKNYFFNFVFQKRVFLLSKISIQKKKTFSNKQ